MQVRDSLVRGSQSYMMTEDDKTAGKGEGHGGDVTPATCCAPSPEGGHGPEYVRGSAV